MDLVGTILGVAFAAVVFRWLISMAISDARAADILTVLVIILLLIKFSVLPAPHWFH